jgi:nitrate/nitrite-specific signal transduction histidine kinase
MFYRILRQLTVQGRIIGAFTLILSLMVLSIPLVDSINLTLSSRLQQLANVDVQVDRQLLLASKQALSARNNLQRYMYDETASPAVALANILAATQFIKNVESLTNSKDELAGLESIAAVLKSYDTAIRDIQAARQEGRLADVPALTTNVTLYQNDLEVEIDQALRRSENRITNANQEAISTAHSRLLTFQWIYLVLLILAILIGFVLERSITRPISDLQTGSENFRLERQTTHIPEIGNDELTSLARSFNQLTRELSLLYQNLEQQVADRTQALRASFQVSQRLTTILDPQALAASVVDEIKHAFGYYHVHIYLFDDTHENLVMVGGTGEPGEIMLRRGHKLPRGKGLVGRASEGNQVVLVENTSEDPAWLPNPLLPETQSEVAVPIAAGDNVLGVLDVQENRKSGFSAEAVELLQAIANQTAIAVQNTRLYNMAQRKAENETRTNLIFQKIQSATSIESVLQIALRDLGDALSARRASVQIGLGSGNVKGQKQP